MRTVAGFVTLVGLVVVLTAGCGGSEPPAPTEPEGPRPLRFAMVPFCDLPVLYRQSSLVAGYLGRNLGREVRCVLVPDYESMLALLEREGVDLAWLTPLTWIRSRATVGYDLIGSPQRRGLRTHTGVVLTRAESRYRTLGDLRGATFAYVDRFSTTGFVYPNMLLEREGIAPLSFFGKVKFSHNHTASIEGLLAGDYDAVAVYDQAARSAGADPGRLRVIATTSPMPGDPIVVRRTLEREVRERVRDLFLTMARQPGGAETLLALGQSDGTDGFVSTEDREYTLVAEAAGAVASGPTTATSS